MAFTDRTDAGQQLGKELVDQDVDVISFWRFHGEDCHLAGR